jgi:hypothetical protein
VQWRFWRRAQAGQGQRVPGAGAGRTAKVVANLFLDAKKFHNEKASLTNCPECMRKIEWKAFSIKKHNGDLPKWRLI